MSVLENVAFPAQAKRLADPTGEARKALAAVGLDHLAERSATRLSGGQQQRVALARALVGDPDVLLLDEPLSNLDAGLRERMRGELRRLQSELGLTTVLVTHDQAEALSMSDRLAIMEHGVPVETGTPEDVYRRPRTAFAARFLGDTVEIAGKSIAGPHGEVLVETPLGTFAAPGASVGEGPRTIFLRTDELLLHAAAPAGARGFPVRLLQRRFIGGAYEYDVATLADPPSTFRIRAKAGYEDLSALFVEVTPEAVIAPIA